MECSESIHVEGSKCSINVDVGPMLVEMINVKSFTYILQFKLFYICQNCKKKRTDLPTLKMVKCYCNSVQHLKDCHCM